MNALFKTVDAFTRSYIAAALQLADEEIGDVSGDELPTETIERMISDCAVFKGRAHNAGLLELDGTPLVSGDCKQSGTDFWLNRNGHGAGFWDREEIYGEDAAHKLDTLAESFGEVDLYLGDNGLAYLA